MLLACGVPQRRLLTGCIPTGFELLARAAGIRGIDFASFQDDFDLDKNKNPAAGDQFENNFESVAAAIQKTYPQLIYECIEFPSGTEKRTFIEERLQQQMPVLVSLTMQAGCLIMPVVDADHDSFILLHSVAPNGVPKLFPIPKQQLADIYDQDPTGRDVAWLKLRPPGA